MGDSAVIRTLFLGALRIDVYPLVVERGIGKLVDAVLVYLQPFRGSKFLTQVGCEFIVRIDD